MNSDADFVAAIIASPEDDAPRLVYADHLEEHGQHDRATFIRVQCELARLPPSDPRRAVLEAKERGLRPGFTEGLLGQRLIEFLAENPLGVVGDDEVPQFVRDHQALPLHFEPGGWSAIRMDGQLMSFIWGHPDGNGDPEIEDDPQERNRVLAGATAKYPELWLLISPRPENSHRCGACNGTGRQQEHPSYSCDICGGLKWVPAR